VVQGQGGESQPDRPGEAMKKQNMCVAYVRSNQQKKIFYFIFNCSIVLNVVGETALRRNQHLKNAKRV
jgi:hypothetical protein